MRVKADCMIVIHRKGHKISQNKSGYSSLQEVTSFKSSAILGYHFSDAVRSLPLIASEMGSCWMIVTIVS